MAVLMAAGALALPDAAAAERAYYAGAALGQADLGHDCGGCMDSTASARLSVGHELVEIAFPGGSAVNAVELLGFSARGSAPAGARSRFAALALVDALAFKFDAFSLGARLGLACSRSHANSPAAGQDDARALCGILLGLGVGYAINERLALTADLERLPLRFAGQASHGRNVVSLGASWRF